MASQRLTKHNIAILAAAVSLSKERHADALLILLDGSTDWKRIVEITEGLDKPVIVAVDSPDDLEGAAEVGLKPIALNKDKSPLLERLQHALLESAADELIRTNGEVVAVYSGFQQGRTRRTYASSHEPRSANARKSRTLADDQDSGGSCSTNWS